MGNDVSITLAGIPPKGFLPYYDFYPLDASSNLADWVRLTTVMRTNASTAPVFYSEPATTNFSDRFYRTATNHFITPFPVPSGSYPVDTLAKSAGLIPVAKRRCFSTAPSLQRPMSTSSACKHRSSAWSPPSIRALAGG